MINRDSSGFLRIAGATLQEIFNTTDPEDARANPIKYSVTFETTHDDAERTQSGDLPESLPTILNRKAKLEVTWNKLPVAWLGALFQRLNLVYKNNASFQVTQNISVSYMDMSGQMRTMNCYVGPTITGSYIIDVAGQDYWDGVRLSFIEK